MVGVVPGPELRSQCGNGLSGVFHDRPAVVGLVSTNWVEEVIAVDGFKSCNQKFLLFVLNLSAMLPAFKGESISSRKSFECLIASDLMKWCVLEGSLGDGTA